MRLWRHEALRIFHDRLICKEDKQLVLDKIDEIVSARFATQRETVLADPCLFGDFTNMLQEG